MSHGVGGGERGPMRYGALSAVVCGLQMLAGGRVLAQGDPGEARLDGWKGQLLVWRRCERE